MCGVFGFAGPPSSPASDAPAPTRHADATPAAIAQPEREPEPQPESEPRSRAEPARDPDLAEPLDTDVESGRDLTPRDALDLLHAGADRWAAGSPEHRNTSAERRRDAADHPSTPIAAVLACSDARVPVERIFDRGVGDLFVVRNAGNVGTAGAAGSIEYGVAHLNAPVLLVMGHTNCGAVAAAVDRILGANESTAQTDDADDAAMHARMSPVLARLIDEIAPAVRAAHQELGDADRDALIARVTELNVRRSIENLIAANPLSARRIAAGETIAVGAVYDIRAGELRWLDAHRDARALAAAAVERFNAAEAAAAAQRSETASPSGENPESLASVNTQTDAAAAPTLPAADAEPASVEQREQATRSRWRGNTDHKD
jgi:carbonic anhydrase